MSSLDEYHIALTGGTWRLAGWVLRWTLDPVPVVASVHDLIACPTCRARVDQTCRTKTGHRTNAHGSRLTPRLCKCGATVAPQRRYCDLCRMESHRMSAKSWRVRNRARMEAAA